MTSNHGGSPRSGRKGLGEGWRIVAAAMIGFGLAWLLRGRDPSIQSDPPGPVAEEIRPQGPVVVVKVRKVDDGSNHSFVPEAPGNRLYVYNITQHGRLVVDLTQPQVQMLKAKLDVSTPTSPQLCELVLKDDAGNPQGDRSNWVEPKEGDYMLVHMQIAYGVPAAYSYSKEASILRCTK